MSEEIKDPTQPEVEAFRMAQICLTADYWRDLDNDTNGPRLEEGEIGIDKTSGVLKIGYDNSKFSEIPNKFTFYPNSQPQIDNINFLLGLGQQENPNSLLTRIQNIEGNVGSRPTGYPANATLWSALYATDTDLKKIQTELGKQPTEYLTTTLWDNVQKLNKDYSTLSLTVSDLNIAIGTIRTNIGSINTRLETLETQPKIIAKDIQDKEGIEYANNTLFFFY